MPQPLDGLRVVDLSSWIAGAYCTRLLSDAGADVVVVDPPGGAPLRRWSASGAKIAHGRSGALFNHLAGGKRSVLLDPADASARDRLDGLLAHAEAVVWSPGAVTEQEFWSPGAMRARHPHLVVTTITPFGLDNPWSDRPATEFTLQAWSGGIIGLARGNPDRPPVHVGGQVGEWTTGVTAAVGTLAALRTGAGRLVDVSMLEVQATCLTYYPVTFHDQLGRPMRRRRYVPAPGVSVARDGLVGLGVGTGQQWLDFAAMVGHPEWGEDPRLFLDRSGIASVIDDWLAEHDVAEIRDLATAMGIPNAPIVNGADAPAYPHFVQRGAFRRNPADGALNPVPPLRISSVETLPARPAPAVGDSSFTEVLREWRARDAATAAAASPGALPLSGLRILDMTAYWAGPLVGQLLAMLGADVIHLESPRRPDGVRLVGGVPQTEPQYWERGPIFSALNTNKSSLTVDLNDARGRDLVRRVVATCDAVVENYTPRVLEQLGLDHAALQAVKPDLVTVRMPGFGLEGPWRDLAAFAFVIEDASGLTWLTGHPDEPPIEPYCVGDPNAGLHALLALLLALEQRDRTGEGALVEAAMVDAALSIAAEQVIEHSAYGALLTRAGNRGPVAAPQGLYAPAVDPEVREEQWVAIAVATDEQWEALVGALGSPAWAAAPDLRTTDGRAAAHDLIDERLAAWCAERSGAQVVDTLWAAGVPVARVMQPHQQPELPPLQARGFFEELEHPVAGRSRYSSLPMRFSNGPERWNRRHAPLLGEHSRELLRQAGVVDDELAELEAAGVIGCALAPVGDR